MQHDAGWGVNIMEPQVMRYRERDTCPGVQPVRQMVAHEEVTEIEFPGITLHHNFLFISLHT